MLDIAITPAGAKTKWRHINGSREFALTIAKKYLAEANDGHVAVYDLNSSRPVAAARKTRGSWQPSAR